MTLIAFYHKIFIESHNRKRFIYLENVFFYSVERFIKLKYYFFVGGDETFRRTEILFFWWSDETFHQRGGKICITKINVRN